MTSSSILCGTDLSPAAVAATDVAAALARRLQLPLVLVSVAEPAVSGNARALRAQAAALDREALQREAERLRARGTEVREEFRSGIPDEELLAVAREAGARLCVVASQGHRAPLRWWLGSVAEAVAESAPIPTLVVRQPEPLQAWLLDDRPLHVFAGSDFTAQSDAALAWVRELRTIAPCQLTAAYVAWAPAARAGGAGEFPELTPDFGDDEAATREALRGRVAAALGEVPVDLLVEAGSGRVETRLAELAREARADLVVVGTHQWHGLERLWHHSVSRGLLHHAPMNIACVPAGATS